MMAINHAMTGALIGLTLDEPAAALPLAFLSHFVLDAIPHYDPVDGTSAQKIDSKKFFYVQIVAGAILCFLLVVLLAVAHPKRWLTAAVCAFLATSPDLFWIPRYLSVKRTGKDAPLSNWFLRFHSWIQWCTGPQLLSVEIAWLAATGALVAARL